MNYPDNHTIRIGTLAKGSSETPKYLQSILGHGFESFQINFWSGLKGVELSRLAEEVRDVLDGSGAIISSLGMFGNPLEDSEDGEATRQGFAECIEHAHLFGCSIVAGFTGRVPETPIPENLPRFREVFSPLADLAAAKGVRIAFENCPMGGNWKTGNWNLAHNPQAWELLFEAVPGDHVGLEWEPCHQMCQLIDPIPQLAVWTPKIFHVHGKCASVYPHIIRTKGIGGPDEFCHHRHPGFGDCNWTDVISQLRMHGFKGCIDIEGWHDPVYREDLEMTGQVRSLQYLKACRGGDFFPNPE